MKVKHKNGDETNLISLIITLICAANTALMAFDIYHLTSEQLDAIIQVVSIVGTMAGIGMNHRKPNKNMVQ